MSEEMRFSEPIVEPVKEPEKKSDSTGFKNIWQKIKEIKNKFKFKKENIFAGLVAVIVLASLAFGGNFYLKAKKLESQSQTASAGSAGEAQRIIAEVGKLLVLPADEEPTVATISDASKLSGQAFFANAQNGDKVLIYNKAGKAILYNPSAKKIVEVAPLNVNQTK